MEPYDHELLRDSLGRRSNIEKNQIFLCKEYRTSDFEFNDKVAKVFDDMLAPTIPFYAEQQSMIAEITTPAPKQTVNGFFS